MTLPLETKIIKWCGLLNFTCMDPEGTLYLYRSSDKKCKANFETFQKGISKYICIYLYIYMYIYIHNICVDMCVCVCMHIFMNSGSREFWVTLVFT